jgi:hypothetical protein
LAWLTLSAYSTVEQDAVKSPSVSVARTAAMGQTDPRYEAERHIFTI